MALGKIKADQLEHSTAGTVDTQFVVNGSAKVLCTFNGTASGATVRTSFNVSSTDDDSTGQYGVNFTNAMSGTEFTPTGSNIGDSTTSLRTLGIVAGLNANTSSSINFATTEADGTGAYVDWTHVNTVVHGDLA